jgi:hypothetical protein
VAAAVDALTPGSKRLGKSNWERASPEPFPKKYEYNPPPVFLLLVGCGAGLEDGGGVVTTLLLIPLFVLLV